MNNQACLTAVLAVIIMSCFDMPGIDAEYAVIKGKVIDKNNIAVKGAEIAITDTSGIQLNTAISNKSGAFSLPNIKKGLYKFRIEAAGFYTVLITRHSINPDTAQSFKLELIPINGFESADCEKGTFSGKIVDDESNEPLPGVEVHISNNQKSIAQWDGKFKIENIPSGRFDITARATAYSIITIKDVVLDSSKCYSIDFRMIHGKFKSLKLPIIY